MSQSAAVDNHLEALSSSNETISYLITAFLITSTITSSGKFLAISFQKLSNGDNPVPSLGNGGVTLFQSYFFLLLLSLPTVSIILNLSGTFEVSYSSGHDLPSIFDWSKAK